MQLSFSVLHWSWFKRPTSITLWPRTFRYHSRTPIRNFRDFPSSNRGENATTAFPTHVSRFENGSAARVAEMTGQILEKPETRTAPFGPRRVTDEWLISKIWGVSAEGVEKQMSRRAKNLKAAFAGVSCGLFATMQRNLRQVLTGQLETFEGHVVWFNEYIFQNGFWALNNILNTLHFKDLNAAIKSFNYTYVKYVRERYIFWEISSMWFLYKYCLMLQMSCDT